MKKIYFILKVIAVYIFFISLGFSAKSNYFDEGRLLFEKKQFDKSKILFERDIVYNPKSEKSYLYLAKIFSKKENDEEQETN